MMKFNYAQKVMLLSIIFMMTIDASDDKRLKVLKAPEQSMHMNEPLPPEAIACCISGVTGGCLAAHLPELEPYPLLEFINPQGEPALIGLDVDVIKVPIGILSGLVCGGCLLAIPPAIRKINSWVNDDKTD